MIDVVARRSDSSERLDIARAKLLGLECEARRAELRILPPSAQISVTLVRPVNSMPASSIWRFSAGVSGSSLNFSSVIISTDFAPHLSAVNAQSTAIAPPPTTTTWPESFGFAAKKALP